MSRDSNVNIRATVNGKEVDAAGVTALLDVLFRGGWLEDVIRTALAAPATAMEQANADLSRRMAALRETLDRTVNRVASSASGDAEQPAAPEDAEQGDAR